MRITLSDNECRMLSRLAKGTVEDLPRTKKGDVNGNATRTVYALIQKGLLSHPDSWRYEVTEAGEHALVAHRELLAKLKPELSARSGNEEQYWTYRAKHVRVRIEVSP